MDFSRKFLGDFRDLFGLPGPRGGRKRILREKRWPVQGSTLKSVPWGPVSWPFFVFECVTPKNAKSLCLCALFFLKKWPRTVSPRHGFQSRPLIWPSFFAGNPFPATPGPGEARKLPKTAPFFLQQTQNFIFVWVFLPYREREREHKHI